MIRKVSTSLKTYPLFPCHGNAHLRFISNPFLVRSSSPRGDPPNRWPRALHQVTPIALQAGMIDPAVARPLKKATIQPRLHRRMLGKARSLGLEEGDERDMCLEFIPQGGHIIFVIWVCQRDVAGVQVRKTLADAASPNIHKLRVDFAVALLHCRVPALSHELDLGRAVVAGGRVGRLIKPFVPYLETIYRLHPRMRDCGGRRQGLGRSDGEGAGLD